MTPGQTGDHRVVPAENAARGAETIAEALREIEAEGYTGQFRALGGGTVECFTCRRTSPAGDFAVEQMVRLEGPTDPADMVAIAALTCPRCAAQGTLLLAYGPDSSLEDADVLQALGAPRHRRGVPGTAT